jgi:hypothetical protein
MISRGNPGAAAVSPDIFLGFKVIVILPANDIWFLVV